MNLDLKNKVVLITGGAKGIGAAITTLLAQEGAIPIVVDRDAAACELLNSALEREGLNARFVQQDLSLADNCKEVVKQVYSEFQRMDGLVNNAGINDKVGLENGSPQEFLCSLQRNLLHYFNMAHYALPYLKATRGCIINISSKTAITGQGGTSGYAGSKRSNPCIDSRMGCGIAALRNSCERNRCGGSHDSTLRSVAPNISKAERKAQVDPFQNPIRKADDHTPRGRGDGGVSGF